MSSVPIAPLGKRVAPGTADRNLLEYIASNDFERVFLVTGKRSFAWFEKKGFIHRVSNLADTMRWSDARPNPEFSNLQQGLEVISGHNPDLVIGVGGGSVLDMAKLLAATYPLQPVGFDTVTGGHADLSMRKPHLILVPTTAGSGAEATHFSVIYRDAIKHSIAGAGLLPDYIVLDPVLVTTGEPGQLAASGLDALSQCIESIWARGATEQSRQRAVEGLRALASSMPSFALGDKSRAGVTQWGSHLGGHAINISKTTASHALSYVLTMRLGVPHGIAVASTLGYFIDHHSKNLEPGDSTNHNLGPLLRIIRDSLGLTNNASAIEYFESLFDQLGLDKPRSYWPQNRHSVGTWLRSANPERLANHPIRLDQKNLAQILEIE